MPAPTRAAAPETVGRLLTAVRRLADAQRLPVSAHGLTETRYAALLVLDAAGPMRPSAFAAALAITRPTTTRLIDVLLEGGWIARDTDPTDGRACLISVTDHGRRVLDQAHAEASQDLQAHLDDLTPAERATLRAALPILEKLAAHPE